MDLFEILFIMLFILFPIIEQMRKGKNKGGKQPGPSQPEPTEPDTAARSRGEEEPGQAADMVPDDLWAVLTGEQRPGGPGGLPQEAGAELEREAPGSAEVGEPSAPAPAGPWEEAPWHAAPDPRWDTDEAEEAPVASSEYRGPEAYSLETMPPAAESLEREPPPPEVRHRAFHDLVDQPPARRSRQRSSLSRSLRNPQSLRHAVRLREILGPPKAYE